jgi:pimeloyl-ACP methyl ester carboxylesterase
VPPRPQRDALQTVFGISFGPPPNRLFVALAVLSVLSAGALTGIERYDLSDFVREDYLFSYEGDRFVESMRYVRAYPTELPVLRDLLQEVETPVQIIAGAHDSAVPPVNGEFLHERLPHRKLDVVDAGHFTWEDAPDEYAALVTSWWSGGYATV